MTAPDDPTKLSDLVDTLVEGTSGDRVSVGDLLSTLNTRSYGPLLLLPGLMGASPLGAVPGMSIVTGSLILLTAGQLLAGMSHPWFPSRLLDLEFDRERLTSTRKKLRPWLAWAERPIRSRLTTLIEPPFEQVAAACCIALALLFYPLALVPFGVFLPAIAVCFFGLALSARDGLLAAFAFVLTVGTVWTAIAFWPF